MLTASTDGLAVTAAWRSYNGTTSAGEVRGAKTPGITQTITFPQPANVAVNTGPVTLTATATSGLTVAYTSTTVTVCTITGTSLTPHTVGTCTINADQTGNGDYLPAPQVTRSITITATPTPTPGVAQNPVNNCVTPPGKKAIPRAGLTRLTRPHCRTNAGQKVTTKVIGQLASRGDVTLFKVIRKKNGAVFIRTYGYRLKLTITWSAPATGTYAAYKQTRTYRTYRT